MKARQAKAADSPEVPPGPSRDNAANASVSAAEQHQKSLDGEHSAGKSRDAKPAAVQDFGRTEPMDCHEGGLAGVSETVEAPGGRRCSDGGGSNSPQSGKPSQPTASSTAPEQQQDTASTEAPAAQQEGAFHPPSSSVAHNRRAAAVADLQNLPVLPEVVRYRDGKKDVPMLCLVQGCGVDLSAQAEYYQRYRVCKDHLKYPALLVDGVAQRFCQQCGRFHELAEFDGEKRNCRARLEQHNSRRRKVFVNNQGTKRNRTGKERSAQKLHSGEDVDEMGEDNHAFLEDMPLPRRLSTGRRSKQSSVPHGALRRGRGLPDESDLQLTAEEKEAILLLRHAEENMQPPIDHMQQQQMQRGGGANLADMPRFLSEPVRGGHTWRTQPEKGADAAMIGLLPPHVQDMLGRFQRQPSQPHPLMAPQPLAQPGQLSTDLLHGVGVGLSGKGGSLNLGRRGASAFTAVASQPLVGGPPASWADLGSLLPNQYSGGPYPRSMQEEKQASLKAMAPGPGPFAMEGGGMFRSQTEPAGRRAAPQDAMRKQQQPPMRKHSANPQLLAATVPRDGFSNSRPQDVADFLRSLDAATNPMPAKEQPPGAINPFAPQRTPAAWPSQQPARAPGNLPLMSSQGSSLPKASVLLRQMADLAASAEQAMEQMAIQQTKSGQLSLLDAFPTPFQGARQPSGGGMGLAGLGSGLLGSLAGMLSSGGMGNGIDPGASHPLGTSQSSGLSSGGGLSSAELLAVLSGLESLPSLQKGQLLEAVTQRGGGMEGALGGRADEGMGPQPHALPGPKRGGTVQQQDLAWNGDAAPVAAPQQLPRMPSGRGLEGQDQRTEHLLAALLAASNNGQWGAGRQGGVGGELSAVQELMSLLQQGVGAASQPMPLHSNAAGDLLK